MLTAVAGVALFAWLVWRVGPAEIWGGFHKIGWGFAGILVLGGLRFAARAAAWALCVEPPHRLRFADAFNAVVCGDTIGNVTPLGPLVGEPAKIACVRGRLPLGVALTALAIENVVYMLSVAAMIAAGAIALLYVSRAGLQTGPVTLPGHLRELSEVAVGITFLMFAAAGWLLWRRPAVISRWLPVKGRGDASQTPSRIERLRSLESEMYTFAARRRGALVPLAALELGFHALGVAEKHLTLTLILGQPPTLLTSFIIETADRLVTVAFKFVPFQVGVGEFGGGLITQLLGLGAAPGVTLQVVRKARMAVWSLIGTALLVRLGARRILDDAAADPSSER